MATTAAADVSAPAGGGEGPIFVVGAGPSGLAAAWRLTQNGHQVVVLESRDRVGGQLLTVKQDGFLMEAGTTILPAAYEDVMRLVREAGLLGDLIGASSLMGFMRDGQLHTLRADNLALDAARTKLLSTKSKLKVARLVLDTLRMRRVLSYEDLSLAAAFDTETPRAYATRVGLGDELYDYLIEPTVRGGAGVPGDVISVVEFFFLWQKVLGTKLFAFRDGYSSLPERLAAGIDVRLSCNVREVVEDGGKVTVTLDGPNGLETHEGAGAVVSSMGNLVPEIVPQLPESRKEFLRALNYTHCINVNFALSEPPAIESAFIVVPRPEAPDLFAAILEHNKAPDRTPPGKGLVTLYGMNDWSARHMDADDETVIADILRDGGEKIVPGISDTIEFARVNRWYPILVDRHPGLYRALGRFHAARDRRSRIHLAGSYNSSGNLNTAAAAGERAARELQAALSLARAR
ncbi:MAG: protoporphyrinogen/coproporphyrinogen oxidase [Solirubrobacteraceae bacterium]